MTNPLREHLRLSAIDIKRIVLHKNFLLVIAVLFLLACYDLFWITPRGDPKGLLGLASTTKTDHVHEGIVSGIAGASALAVDTQAGFVGLVLSRNVHRRAYLLHKAVAIFTIGALGTLIRNLFLLAMGALTLPWRVPGLSGCYFEWVGKSGDLGCAIARPNLLKNAPPPFPALFLDHPVLHDVVSILMTGFGTGVLALIGMLVAVCGGNVYLAMATPIVLPFAIRFLTNGLPDWTAWFEPTELLGFWVKDRYFYIVPGLEYRLGIWLAYWIGLAAVLIGLSLLIAEKRELAFKEHGA